MVAAITAKGLAVTVFSSPQQINRYLIGGIAGELKATQAPDCHERHRFQQRGSFTNNISAFYFFTVGIDQFQLRPQSGQAFGCA